MGQESPYESTSRTLTLPPDEAVPRTEETYRVVGIRLGGELDIGVSVLPGDDRSIDEFPQTVHDALPDLAAEHLDFDRLRAETTRENWPVIGIVSLSRVDCETVDVSIEWIPP